MKLTYFKDINFLPAIKMLFRELNVPMNYVADEPTTAREILKDCKKNEAFFDQMEDVYFVGMVDDAAFEGNESLAPEKIKSDYDGILIFGITLKQRPNNLLPTRSQLAEISRAFNREFYYTPVVLVFKYKDDQKNYLAFANTERLKYKQEWREGEKAGKVSLLRDINIEKPHRGHEDIINQLRIPNTGTKAVDSFAKLYTYWQEVFSVSVLNKKFYQELSNWYFWARGEVVFPSAPLRIDFNSESEFEEALNEHNGKNLIRLLTRILFVWFVKEKGLIPQEIFDENFISEKLLDEFEPQKPHGFFAQGKHTSRYYRAVLQNLFFATLNCEKDKREFRKEGSHRNTTHLMRYRDYFKNPDFFLELMESQVPFMNGGLFDCLDKPHKEKKGKQGGDIIIYQDGFSDRDDNPLSVPDYLFFDKDEEVDLRKAYGQAKYKKVNTKGLLKILESYKFTITENTPIEEDVALDPELLGRVFENLLASYNPETKTTARKQTGSFYTPREIVNYMVDESLIAYLRHSVDPNLWDCSHDEINNRLHELVAFDIQAKFEADSELKTAIIKSIDNCKILDPACGSGAFPMGVLQKMVHILHKVDPDNKEWKQRQLNKIDEAISRLDEIEDSEIREKSVKELKEQKKDIEQAFERNDLDYGRKLYLIENCIYGLDIQSIAVQISKLRFFISLIVDQHDEKEKNNFGIRPLPNLETKFVAANTLIGVTKEQSLFDNQEVKKLEKQIKLLNKKLFSIKSPSRKRELREEIKAVRNEMATILEDEGLDNQSARQLAEWDPFDQNTSSPFFDPEWMFDISEGFDVIIGNPPYISYYGNTGAKLSNKEREYIVDNYNHVHTKNDRINSMNLMTEQALKILNKKGVVYFITNKTQAVLPSYKRFREYLLENFKIQSLVDHLDPFEAIVDCIILGVSNEEVDGQIKYYSGQVEKYSLLRQPDFSNNPQLELAHSENDKIIQLIEAHDQTIDSMLTINRGVNIGGCFDDFLSDEQHEDYYPYLGGTRNIKPFNYRIIDEDGYFNFDLKLEARLRQNGATIVLGNPERYIVPHLFIPESGQRIMAAFCDNRVYGSYGLLIGTNSTNVKLTKASCSLLNSSLFTFYCLERGILRKGNKATPHVGVRGLNKVPIPNLATAHIDLLALLCDITTVSWQYSVNRIFEKIVNSVVFNLYFPEHMIQNELDVLEFVDKDVSEVLKGREFHNLTDPDKEKVVEELGRTWGHPDNEVRNRMKLFAVRSPEILKPILES